MDFLSRMRGERPIAKAAPTLTEELARLDALLARQEAAIRAAFDQYVRELKSPAMVKEIADLIDRGDIEGALRIVDTYVSRMASVLPRNFVAAGTAEASALASLFASMKPRVAVSFNAGDPVAAALMRSATLSFIREFTDRQRAATRFALAESIARGDGSAAAARAFRSSIGLTERQNRSVMRYRALLENLSAQALDVGLRDHRFDPTVRRAVDSDTPLTPSQIDRMVEAYARRKLISRSQTIARTEGVRTMSEARDEAFRQMMETSGIDPALVDEIWNSTRDNRTRETHREMNLQVVPYGQPFVSPSGARLRYPGDPNAPADEVINCRCHKTRQIRQVGQPFTGKVVETP